MSSIIFVLTESATQLYLIESIIRQAEAFLSCTLSIMLLTCLLMYFKNLLIRLLLLVRYFLYFLLRDQISIFNTPATFHVFFLVVLLSYFWDQQIIRFSKVNHFAD